MKIDPRRHKEMWVTWKEKYGKREGTPWEKMLEYKTLEEQYQEYQKIQEKQQLKLEKGAEKPKPEEGPSGSIDKPSGPISIVPK